MHSYVEPFVRRVHAFSAWLQHIVLKLHSAQLYKIAQSRQHLPSRHHLPYNVACREEVYQSENANLLSSFADDTGIQ